jgi:hypothetical protein
MLRRFMLGAFLCLALFCNTLQAASVYEFAGVYNIVTSTRNEYRLAVLPINDEFGLTISLHQTKGVTVRRQAAYVFRQAEFDEATNSIRATLTNNLYVMQVRIDFDPITEAVSGIYRRSGPRVAEQGDITFSGTLDPCFARLLEGRDEQKSGMNHFLSDRSQGLTAGEYFGQMRTLLADEPVPPQRIRFYLMDDLFDPEAMAASLVYLLDVNPNLALTFPFSHQDRGEARQDRKRNFYRDQQTNLIYLSGRSRVRATEAAHLLILSPEWSGESSIRGLHISAQNASVREFVVRKSGQ